MRFPIGVYNKTMIIKARLHRILDLKLFQINLFWAEFNWCMSRSRVAQEAYLEIEYI